MYNDFDSNEKIYTNSNRAGDEPKTPQDNSYASNAQNYNTNTDSNNSQPVTPQEQQQPQQPYTYQQASQHTPVYNQQTPYQPNPQSNLNNYTNENNYNGYYAPKEPPKKKKSGVLSMLALVLSITLISGGVGFGIATLTSGSLKNDLTGDTTTSATSQANNPSKDDKTSHPSLDDLQGNNDTSITNTSKYVGKNSEGYYENLADLVEDIKLSVVFVKNYAKNRGEEAVQGTGSGIVISKDGYIITNDHVISGASKVSVEIMDEIGTSKEYSAKVIGTDADADLAVLKIEANNLVVATLGDSDTLRVGDSVVAVGNPSGLVGTVTKGIVSGLDRRSSENTRVLPSIQTDAAVNFGNSGGALFDMKGQVVGVVNSKIVSSASESLGFAITINHAKPVIDDLLNTGYVTGRPVLGITFLQVSEYTAAAQGRDAGLYVTEINQNLPVAKSGLKLGDTITHIEGTEVSSLSDVKSVLNDKKPGDVLNVTVIRYDTMEKRTTLDIQIEIAEYRGS